MAIWRSEKQTIYLLVVDNFNKLDCSLSAVDGFNSNPALDFATCRAIFNWKYKTAPNTSKDIRTRSTLLKTTHALPAIVNVSGSGANAVISKELII